jgi:hypothetical protein
MNIHNDNLIILNDILELNFLQYAVIGGVLYKLSIKTNNNSNNIRFNIVFIKYNIRSIPKFHKMGQLKC